MNRRAIGPIIIGLMVMLLLAFLVVPMLVVGGASLLFAGGAGALRGHRGERGPARRVHRGGQLDSRQLPEVVPAGRPAVQRAVDGPGRHRRRSRATTGGPTLPGVTSGSNAFGAAGPMQIGIGGASGNQWGGAAVHPASEVVNGVATDEDGDGNASVYDPADAIAGAAKYLVAHGVQQNVAAAIFAYNHADWYVQEVLPGRRPTPQAGSRSPTSTRRQRPVTAVPAAAASRARRTASSPRSSRRTRS